MRLEAAILVAGAALAVQAALGAGFAPLVVDYPQEGSVFPPEMTAPTMLWRDSAGNARAWRIAVAFSDGSPEMHILSQGEPLRLGEIDPRCVSDTNEPPRLTPQQAAARTWIPDALAWEQIKKHSIGQPAKITITGFRDRQLRSPVSRGQVSIQTSRDPVGAPIFYRDVPLMPSELEKGVIKPLAAAAIPLIAWKLRNVGESRSRVVLEGVGLDKSESRVRS